jgi:probable rRNA maturation factor
LIVDFSVEDGVAASWDGPRITSLISSIVERERSTDAASAISVHLVSDATIRQLNAEHRQIDAVTDVLSFPLADALAEPGFVLPEGEPVDLGDVVISYPRAVAQAEDYGHSVEREVAYLVAHGVLHVLGYDHEAASERERMRQKEEEALQPLGFTR